MSKENSQENEYPRAMRDQTRTRGRGQIIASDGAKCAAALSRYKLLRTDRGSGSIITILDQIEQNYLP